MKKIIKMVLANNQVAALMAVLRYIFLDVHTKKFIAHNKMIWRSFKVKDPEAEVILDNFEVPEMHVTYSYFANTLAKSKKAAIKTYLYGDGLYYSKTKLVHNSYNVSSLIRVKPSSEQKREIQQIFVGLRSKLKTKKDFFDLQLLGIDIGIDIYESYLRDFNEPTLKVADPRLDALVEKAITLLVFWRDYFRERKIVGVLISHDNYLWMNALAKTAYNAKVPVYLPNVRGLVYATEPFSVYSCLKDYPAIFAKLSKQEQQAGLGWAKERLKRKVSGEVGVDMHYSTASGYRGVDKNLNVLGKSNRIKILVATHCFYDNPHPYQKLPFVDFYEWLEFLGKISEKTDYDWFVKMHPDPLPRTEEIIKEIIKKYPKMIFLPPNTSHDQIISEGLNFVTTCYGTIGEEYPYLGVPVINAAFNPRIAYDVNWHAENLEHYEELLLQLPSLKKTIDLEKLYEFYFMHHYYVLVDDMIFNSHQAYLKDLSSTGYLSPKVYEYFMKEFNSQKHERIQERIQEFIGSGRRFYFSKGPEYSASK